MKKNLMFLVLAFLSSLCFAQIKELKYDSAKMMDVGNMYSYYIKELGGKKEMNLYFYVKDDKTVECFIDFSTVSPMVMIVSGEINPDVCSWKKVKGYNPFSYLKISGNDVSTAEYDVKNKRLKTSMTYYNNKKELKSYSLKKNTPLYPLYEMSLYQLDLWFAMRNYSGNYKSFEVGTLYNGAVSTSVVSYCGDESVNGINCEKWEISQKGILAKATGKKQTIWLDKNDKYKKVMKYTNTLNVRPVGKLDISFRNRKVMNLNDWNLFVDEKTEEARIRLGFDPKE